MKPEKMSEAIINGASISSIMVPDPKLPSNQPAHDETYAFDYVFLREGSFFAVTREDHRLLRHGIETHTVPNSFLYSYGYRDLMSTCSSHNLRTSLWSKMSFRYSKFQWCLKDDYALVWDSLGSDQNLADASLLRAAILSGQRFRVSMLDEDGLWNVMAVDLVNLEQESSFFNLRTSTAFIPAVIPDEGSQRSSFDLLDSKLTYPEFIQTSMNVIPIFLTMFSDGSYYTYFDELTNDVRKFQHLMVFASKSDDGSRHLINQI